MTATVAQKPCGCVIALVMGPLAARLTPRWQEGGYTVRTVDTADVRQGLVRFSVCRHE